MAENDETGDSDNSLASLPDVADRLDLKMRDLERSANSFARAMSGAFAQAISGGRGLDNILKTLVLRMSDMALRMALKPLENAFTGGFKNLFGGLLGNNSSGGDITAARADIAAAMGAIKPFAAGGVVGTPTYFPLSGGGLGLAGEAGPEAILPLARGSDGRLGVAASGGASTSITIQIATPDAESFRRSESYVTGQIARAVARGQRSQ